MEKGCAYWLFVAILVVVLVIIGGWIISVLWNYLMPVIFGLTTISVKQGIAMFILSNWLFGAKNFSNGGQKE